jgi:protein-disulfide isomerase
VVYGDYLCPRTRRAWALVEELLEELGDRLRVVWRHFPLPERVEAQTRAQRTAEAPPTPGEAAVQRTLPIPTR